MPVFSFLEQCHFCGKVIRVFCTHEGDGVGHSIEDIKLIYPETLTKAIGKSLQNGVSDHVGIVESSENGVV